MTSRPARLAEVQHPADVGAVRREVAAALRPLGWSSERVGRVELAITELATNLLRHAGGGRLLYQFVEGSPTRLELLSLDRGPGGVRPSTARPSSPQSGLGIGLGAVRRMSDEFDLHSPAGRGTAVLARFLGASGDRGTRFGGVTVALPGQEECGDGWAILRDGERRMAVLMVDGLGHGAAAGQACDRARECFLSEYSWEPGRFVERLNLALRSTRGAVFGLAQIEAGELLFVGLGNIAARLANGEHSRSLLSGAGVLGASLHPPPVHSQRAPWSPGCALSLATDGIRVGRRQESDPLLLDVDPSLVAGLIYRDGAHGEDDAGVCVVRADRE